VIRLIFSDVDGTLVPAGGAVSERTRQAVRSAQAAGIPFVIASGRWYVTARQTAEELGLSDGFLIAANGGAVLRMDGTPMKEWTLSGAEASAVYDLAKGRNLMVTAFSPNAICRVNTQALGRPLKRPSGEFYGGKYRIVSDDEAFFEEIGLASPYKMLICAGDMDDLAAVRAELEKMDFALSCPRADNLEIMPRGAGKARAVKWLSEHLGIAPTDCMAIGDQLNDLEMLRAVGWPVAMGNAAAELKAAARIVAPDDTDDGAAQVIERALRGEL